MICENCGSELNAGLKFCTKCGNPVKIESKRSAITSLVFGILSFVLTLLFSLPLIIYQIRGALFFTIWAFLVIILLRNIPSILFIVLGLIFGYISLKNKKTKYAKIGIVLSYLSIVFIVIPMVVYIFN